MGSCIICGVDVDGHVCQSHEQDVCFEFTGSRPEELTIDRFYRGSVDGIADFGVFIDLGDHVTGLLHESELDRRLESVDWQPGDTVYVQVKNVRDNGNVDLGWSLRQDESEFRGSLVDTGDGEAVPGDQETETDGSGATTAEPTVTTRTATVTERERPDEEDLRPTFEDLKIDALADSVGTHARLEAEIVDVRQTSGPTIFELRDETGTVECAAFEAAGVRAYPEAEVGDLVQLEGEVERRRGEIQVETERLEVLDGEDAEAVRGRLENAVDARASPGDYAPLVDEGPAADAHEAVVEAATAIRRAVFEGRPVVVRHDGSVDGFAGAAAVERAVLSLIRAEHEEADAEYHFVDRRPLDGPVYDLEDAMRDVTAMLDARERHGEKVPLFAFVDAGGTAESHDGLDLLSVYEAGRVVVEGAPVDEEVAEAVDAVVDTDEPGAVTGAALAAEVAAAVAPAVADDLRHLPAISFPRAVPDAYADLAAAAGYDAEAVETLRRAVALEAFYQAHGDKRELMADLLFGDAALAERASEQFDERVAEELRAAEPHVERHAVGDRLVGVLDTDAYTHRFEFPPARLLLSALAERIEGDLDALVGVAEDRLVVWSAAPVDVRDVADRVAEAVPTAGVEARGGHDGEIVFLSGERDAVVEAAVEAVADVA